MVELARKSCVLEVPATVGALGEIAAFVLRLAGAAGLDKGATYRLRLAVDELATNVVMHGYRGGDGRITVRGRSGPGRVQIVIEDSAPPFDPVEGRLPPAPGVPPEERRIGGLGIHLALTSVDEFGYAHRDGRNTSTLTVKAEGTDPCPPRP
ncbi:anti-sigma regulatory factor [Streptomyces sp. NBC_00160]|uniref:ATP-binding protein n=1 Tax=Streptomyces sp. NBC_00160 TaxID=2903628 RepID=UPI00224EA5D4|nr:anti-sigma regulatory factor [Streptomyces sp. NBC_00160]MCX5307160.1 anti-sigma regulatory factor [Streptomyces sp. NBC_00160]